MWTRAELKTKAKGSFKANYWKAVFAALILLVIAGGISGYSTVARGAVPAGPNVPSHTADDVNVDISNGAISIDVDDADGGKVHVNVNADEVESLDEVLDGIVTDSQVNDVNALAGPGIVLVGLSIALIVLIVMVVMIAIYAFIFNPLEVGVQRFFLRNLNQRAEVKEIAYGYDNNYMEIVKTVFLRDLFILLWSLLLIIPGIYKSYEYRMIPYLLADDPAMTKDRAFAESKRMMDGQKWKAFVLDLSFLGWNILSVLTLGVLAVFYVAPYQAQTNAALYEKLRYGLPAPQPAPQPSPQWSAPGQPAQPVQPVQPVAYAAAAATAPVAVTAMDATTPMPVAPDATAPMATMDSAGMVDATIPMAPATDEAIPVIQPESRPPIPPFAEVGYKPEDEPEEEPVGSEEPSEPTDSPEA